MDDGALSVAVSRLFVYPIKSCAGVERDRAVLTETGLQWDRAWMVVDERGQCVSQRELPRMALIAPQLKHHEMVVRAPGMLALHIGLDTVESACRVRLWDDVCAAYDMGDVAAQWFTDFLMQDRLPGLSAMKLRLVRFDPEQKRLSSMRWTQGKMALQQFSDGFALLVISEASLAQLNAKLRCGGQEAVGMARFRPNIVLQGLRAHEEDEIQALRWRAQTGDVELALVKPCSRCTMPDIDPQTGRLDGAVGGVLRTYRKDARLQGAISFGMNAIVAQSAQETFDLPLALGQSMQVRRLR